MEWWSRIAEKYMDLFYTAERAFEQRCHSLAKKGFSRRFYDWNSIKGLPFIPSICGSFSFHS
jgi:hypothetical protein